MAFPKKSMQWSILRLILLFGVIMGGFFMCVVVRPLTEIESSSSRGGETSLDKVDNSSIILNNDFSETHHIENALAAQLALHQAHHQPALQSGIDGAKLKHQFQVAKAKMIQNIKEKYGAELFDKTFMTDWNKGGGTAGERVTRGRSFFVSPSVPKDRMETNENEGPSWDRFVRRMAVKILQAQLQNSGDNKDDKLIPFIWASGGHSSAAGHGNYYNESYTANLEKTAKGVFEAVGLDLVGR
jgi:hypothetical protein